MAVESNHKIIKTVLAGADLSAKQYYAVKLSSGEAVVCDGVTDLPFGILQNAPASGEMAEVLVLGESKVNANGALAVDNLIGTAADGQLAAYTPGTDTTKYIIGRVTPGGTTSNAGEIGSAFINCMTPARAA